MSHHAEILDRYPWWTALKHGGLLIASARLPEYFPEHLEPLSRYSTESLRREVTRILDGDERAIGTLLDAVLEDALNLPRREWKKGSEVGPEWSHTSLTRQTLKPRRVWQGEHGALLPVFDASQLVRRKGREKVKRLGVGRGRRAVSRVIEWLRRAEQKLALVTNGRQWRLVHAGPDYDAFCEWDIDLWFREGAPSDQVDALRILLGRNSLTPTDDGLQAPLVQAVLESRKGQAELSSALGERVRLAVEHVIHVSRDAVDSLHESDEDVSLREAYIAATRLVMRCVVILFAEARDLLPRDNPIYHGSYGLEALREQLDRAAGGRGTERLRHAHAAWPRLLSLFRLVHSGSPHKALPIPAYGGKLFEPGDLSSRDPVLRALAAFEAPDNTPSDAAVHHVLELLTRSRVKVRQGRGSTWIEGPVDFSDLSSEYIGILYEGLLDFELRRAYEPMLFLNLGDQPALPFYNGLTNLTGKERGELLKKLRTTTKKIATEDEADDSDDDEEADGAEEDETNEEGDSAAEEPDAEDEADVDEDDAVRDKKAYWTREVSVWLQRAVRDAGWTKRGADLNDPEVVALAKTLCKRIVLPGEYFLVRWGGTRKGAGTFYTRPQLAGPTTRRTLRPLAYERPAEGESTEAHEPSGEWLPRTPEQILALKVCDPAMGSGSFLVSALRFLVDALMESLHYHGRLDPGVDRTVCKLADGLPADHPSQETLPVPLDHPEFEDRLRARLRRHVVERCIYGVDVDALAVELGQMALWVETMDRSLPFGFLDHKLKVGNSLVGCWLDRFQDYPAMAWERDGGDANHDRFVHHKRLHIIDRGKRKGEKEERGDVWTQGIKEVKNAVKSELADVVQGQLSIWRNDVQPEDIQARAARVFEKLHELPVHETERRAEAYRELQEDPDYQRLKQALDTWCAVWFWPGDRLDDAPMPRTYLAPDSVTSELTEELRRQHGFFHWELEFPDVFTPERTGFDALVGNPPWEIRKPNSKEFFSNLDPLYRAYGKQEALDRQRSYFTNNPTIEDAWLRYRANLRALSNWVKYVAWPFGDPENPGDSFSFTRSGKHNTQLHDLWRHKRKGRSGLADPAHPFRHQGSADINTYKMFLEASRALARDAGRLGFVVPSGLYTDKGSTNLRRLFLERSRWEWLFGFENREKVFDIDSRFKFCPVIVQKGGQTKEIRAAFMHRSLDDWNDAERHVLDYPSARVAQFSPRSRAILEIRSERDLEVLNKLYADTVLLGDDGPDGWGIKYATEFHMTNDSRLFPPLPRWTAKGYEPDEYGHWLKGGWFDYLGPSSILERDQSLVLSRDGRRAIRVDDIADVALPVYEGRMIGQFDFSAKGWVSGKGRGAEWRDILFSEKVIEPQFCMAVKDYISARDRSKQPKAVRGMKLGFMDVSSATNQRTMIAALVSDAPCGNKVPVLAASRGSAHATAFLCAVLNSLIYDFQMRARLGGLTLNYFIVEETALPRPDIFAEARAAAAGAALRLGALSWRYSPFWVADHLPKQIRGKAVETLWALTPHERLRLRAISDATVAHLYGLDIDDFAWIVRDCDHPEESTTTNEFTRKLDPKGFWRIDKDRPPELRHPVLSLVAFHELKARGLDAFLAMNDGEGWMLPDTLRLADYELGHDDRAKEAQPVASVLGPRYLPWQLEQEPEASWEECRRHAELIEQIVPPPQPEPPKGSSKRGGKSTDKSGDTSQLKLALMEDI